METVQVQADAIRTPPVSMVTALLKLLQQATRKPEFDRGKHVRAGYTKNKSLGESKARRKMAKESRKRNRRP